MARDMSCVADVMKGPRAGFTLFETLLAAAIIVILGGTLILAMGGWYSKQSFDEGAKRVESILHMARAEASGTGRRVRLAFDPSSLKPRILWEPEPLAQPGVFVQHYGQWAHDMPTDVLQFVRCRRTGPAAARLLTYSDAQEPVTTHGDPLESITFLPDGSCDSAVLEMAAADGLDPRIGRIQIDGVTGGVNLRMLTPAELEELEEGDTP